MNQEHLKLLKSITPSAKLPKQENIDFEMISKDCLLIKMSCKGVIANMQTNESAFESWAIVLKAAISDVEKVILDLTDIEPATEENAHYKRFLMRVANFKKAYKWFDVTQNLRAEVDDMQALLDSKRIVVNHPLEESKESDEDMKPEYCLQKKLVETLRKDSPITDEQLPVGLFIDEVSKANALTPGGKSQIDVWQLLEPDRKTVCIYELKAEGNKPIGIISELMFYVYTVKHIVDGRINYQNISDVKPLRHFKDFAEAVTNGIQEVKGYFTAPAFHPLIAQQAESIKEILNDNTFGISFDFKYTSDLIQ